MINALLNNTLHRPWPLPNGRWRYYQEWNKAMFLHWAVPPGLLQGCIPPGLSLDTFNGQAYISLVAFTMQRIRPRHLPSARFLSDFPEINIRTYIDTGNKKGVYFLNIEAGKGLSAFIARKLSGLPYEKANMRCTRDHYSSVNTAKNFSLDISFEIKETLPHKTALDKWLTERYCLYLDQKDQLYRYEIHHKEWELKQVAIEKLRLQYTIGQIPLINQHPTLAHYSKGVQVVAWKRQALTADT